jgi:hypothetical protein
MTVELTAQARSQDSYDFICPTSECTQAAFRSEDSWRGTDHPGCFDLGSIDPTAIALADGKSSSKKKGMSRPSESMDNMAAAGFRGGTRKWRLVSRSVVLPKSTDEDMDERVYDMPLPTWVVPAGPKPTDCALVTLLPGFLATTPPFTFRPPPGLPTLALAQQVDLCPL